MGSAHRHAGRMQVKLHWAVNFTNDQQPPHWKLVLQNIENRLPGSSPWKRHSYQTTALCILPMQETVGLQLTAICANPVQQWQAPCS